LSEAFICHSVPKLHMSCLKESILKAMKTLPTIYPYIGSDAAEHLEDPNLKDVNHLAETIESFAI
jgi:hypothetical protein